MLRFFEDSWFRMFESRLAKAAGVEVEMPRRCGAKHIFKSKRAKHAPQLQSNFCYDLEKCHAAVARSTNQNAQNTTFSERFLKLRSGKWAEAQIKMRKTPHSRSNSWSFDLENGTPLWPEGHFQVKMHKTPAFCHAFGPSDVEKVSDRRDR